MVAWNFFMNDGNTLELSVIMDGGKIKDVNTRGIYLD